ncbi:LOW QUALITY PROTEIN: ATP-binding cassette sub-family A member 3 [Galemys pyrenaicus]|uniref:ATP-binding cassette sub-family A member 3 n=1 Tax=Galemys pyrenaicus TaxID=202257 RepID=A0A8J6DM84_GALPY|nr:LOW QUALITY PROTEIN: ATP-binding cassette sub-family A member 3 [Galemys pyrenaicus]
MFLHVRRAQERWHPAHVAAGPVTSAGEPRCALGAAPYESAARLGCRLQSPLSCGGRSNNALRLRLFLGWGVRRMRGGGIPGSTRALGLGSRRVRRLPAVLPSFLGSRPANESLRPKKLRDCCGERCRKRQAWSTRSCGRLGGSWNSILCGKMDSLSLTHFRVLLWKNFLLKRRNVVSLILEIFTALWMTLLLVVERKYTKTTTNSSIHFQPLPFVQLPSFLKDNYQLVYVPSESDVAKSITEMVKKDLNISFPVLGFSSEENFENYIKYQNKTAPVLAAIVFDHDFKNSKDSLPLKVKYHLRFGSTFHKVFRSVGLFSSRSKPVWNTDLLFPAIPAAGPRNPDDTDGGDPGYIRGGFLAVQHSLDKAIMEYHNKAAKTAFDNVIISARRFPYPPYISDLFFANLMPLLPLVIITVFSLTLFTLLKTIVMEKETRLKEYQLMIGLSNAMLWSAYFITFLLMFFITIFLLCIAHEEILQNSDISFIIVFLLCYAIALINSGFLISTFFSKTSLAAAVGGFLYILIYLPYLIFHNMYAHLTLIEKLFLCLSINVALSFGTDQICKLEIKQYGARWNNFLSPVSPDDSLTLGHIMGMLLLDASLCALMTWYIDAVFPGKYGVPKPWYFFVQRSYWLGESSTNQEQASENVYSAAGNEYFESEPAHLVVGISIQHLYKEFILQNTTILAVQDLTLNFYEGQITVLLGPNGAGKTTTLSILTGFYVPTKGKVYVSGYDISKDMPLVRKNLGLCPQDNILFPDLTVSEHLYFYCVIKGVPTEEQSVEIRKMLTTFELLEKRHSLSRSLSGGMKRKLSIMIALIGGSKVVILDEPTSGMDPVSRRTTWNLLQSYKQDRTILLTTHNMDEADVLGDRIAIMVKGSLQCCGSAVFLKKIYGILPFDTSLASVGYHVVMVKEPHCKVTEISELILSHIPSARLESDVTAELSFVLPKEYTHRFKDLFYELEDKQKELGIVSFGVSITTMEEVFFKVNDMAVVDNKTFQDKNRNENNQNMNNQRNEEQSHPSVLSENSNVKFNTGWPLHCQQFYAMFIKKALFTWRNWKLILLQLLAFLGMVYLMNSGVSISVQSDEPAREMDLQQYGKTIVPYSISGNSNFEQNLRSNLEILLKAKNQQPQEVQGDLEEYLVENKKCIYSCIVALSIKVNRNQKKVTIWFNNEAYHSPSLSLAVLDNIVFMTLSGQDASITPSNKPQPFVTATKSEKRRTSGAIVAFNLFFGISIFISGFCLLVVNERITKAKHIQFVTGVYTFNFWISALLWDFITYFISCCLLLLVFLACGLDLLIKKNYIMATWIILLLFGWSVIPFMYLMSFLFSSNSSAYIKLFLINYFAGIFGITLDLLTGPFVTRKKSVFASVTLYLMMVLPIHNFGMSISKYYDIQDAKRLCSSLHVVSSYINCNLERNLYTLEEDTIGRYLLAMAVSGFIFFLLLFYLETSSWIVPTFVFQNIFFGVYKKLNKDKVATKLSGESKDEDVENERKRILSQPLEMLNATVLIKELIKIFFTCPPVLAVRNISIAIEKQECFGLLGLNGAGKTSTFQILTGEETATSGGVFIDNYSITRNVLKVRSKISYCPQFDALLDYMTAREIMIMYARLSGIPENQINHYVNNFLKSLNLESQADKFICTYSGGNKRRVSAAIALMGKSSVIFLDEPSTGMDPLARRLLWNTVTWTRKNGRVIIITSHSMEECDALCTRLAIMVKGKFVCLGSPQHLKNKFGNIYILKTKINTDSEENELKKFKEFIATTFPGSELKQENQGILNYYIPSKDLRWGEVFGILEDAKEQYKLEDYSISQITLEQRRRPVVTFVEIVLTLLFAGTLLLTRKFMVIKKFFSNVVKGFSSEKDFEDYVKKEENTKKVMAAFVFDHEFKNSHDPLPLKVKYYVRLSSFQRNRHVAFLRPGGWETNTLYPTSFSLGPRNTDEMGGSPGYYTEGFLLLQHTLDQAIMKYHNLVAAEALMNKVTVYVQRFPYAVYYHDYFFNLFGTFIPLVILFIFCVNHLTLVQSIVWEKENRLKEYQLMIGLSNWMLWAAYFFTFLSLYAIIILLICIIFFAKMEPKSVIQYSDPSLVFIFLLCFAIATIFFSFLVSTLFNKVNFAVAIGCFLFLASYFPASTVSSNYAQMTLSQKLTSCLISNIAMSLGARFLVRAEQEKIGLKWSNIFTPNSIDSFVFAYILEMLLLDAILYGLVAWYIEAVFPGEYGVPKPWNFFLLRSHWFGDTPAGKNETKKCYETDENKYLEVEPTNLVAGIQINHLYKVFRVQNTIKVAVKDLSLNVYEGQITVLLGHNGAGKSTTISILSGLYPATSGQAYVNGYDISKQMIQIRKNIGICPQKDLFFNHLTIKGVPQKKRSMETDQMLRTFNLLEKSNEFSNTLSGGMKRRLSIIIALIGGSKVVILDEPTSGMDLLSRRTTWNLLQSYKQDRTILLTTHNMDEADVLGDRIAIMVKGSLQCCGSSVFLKNTYGVGYHMVMVKEPHCNVEEISSLINNHVPIATLEKNDVNELSFMLPKEYTHRFEALFTDLEKRQKDLGIADFGAFITTMEEVFLKVSNMEYSQTNSQSTYPQPPSLLNKVSIMNQNRNMSRNEREFAAVSESPVIIYNTGCSLYHQQFHAMFLKRVMYSWRNWKLLLLQILALLGSFAFLSKAEIFSQSTHNERARQMDLRQYGQTIVPLSISGNSNITLIFLQHLKSILESEKQTLKEVQGDLIKYLMDNEDCIHLCIVAFSIEEKQSQITVTALFNNQAYHSPALSLAMVDNILFKAVSGPDASLTIFNKPQPRFPDKEYHLTMVNGHQVAVNIHFGMAILISGFCLLTVTERVSKAKHIQFMSGVPVLVYWLSALLWDFIIFFIACCLFLGVLKFCELDLYVTDYRFLDTMLILMLYGWSAIPLMYLLSFLFTISSSAYIKLVLFNYLSGIFSLLIDTIFEFEMQHSMSSATRTFILNLLQLFPNYNLGKCIAYYFAHYQKKRWCSTKHRLPGQFICNETYISRTVYSFEKEQIAKYLVMMSTTGFVFLLLLLVWETTLWKLRTILNQYIYFGIYKKFKKQKVSKELSGGSEDEDVQNERKKILGQFRLMMNSAVLIKELTKVYFKCPATLAVKNISVEVQSGECFGLLGFNGAGKTTTFQILTGEQTLTSGGVFIDGFSITKNIQKVKSRVGYCPQSDALLEYMTGQEAMIMYARLRGVSESQIQPYVNKWLNSLQLEHHADKLISTYSGGSKRRLSAAIALMGKLSVILLDEPSTGMDPEAQHLLQAAVTLARESGKAIIISSHRMEECDALCTRLAIMVKGKFVCLGTPQHLKNKFGNVYILKIQVKMDAPETVLDDVKFFIRMTFPGSILQQENQRILNYYIPSKDNSWGKVFGILEDAKEQYSVEDYSISQITLEQVFLTFAIPEEFIFIIYSLIKEKIMRISTTICLMFTLTELNTLYRKMYLLTLKQFSVLLWKNFTLKRRRFINLILEVLTALTFPMMILLFRVNTKINDTRSYNFIPQSISTLPFSLQNPQDWELLYVPSNVNVVKEITENVKRNLKINVKEIIMYFHLSEKFCLSTVRGFSSETELESYIKYDNKALKVLAVVVFDSVFKHVNDPLPLQVYYHLRFLRIQRTLSWPDNIGWKTSLLFPVHSSLGPRNPNFHDGGSPGYIREGFLAIQHALDKAIMLYHQKSARKLFKGIRIFIQRFPYPAYSQDVLVWAMNAFLPLMFILMFSPTVLSIMRAIVSEREKRLKEYQLIIGLKNWMIWAAHFLTFLFFYIIIIFLICIFSEPVFRYSDSSFIFVFLMCYAIASIFFGFMVSTFFNKARLAVSTGSILYFASFYPFNSLTQHYGQITLTKKVVACLSSNVALSLGINLWLKLEIKEIGVKWENLWTPASLEDNLVFGYLMGMLLLDAFLYGLVTWFVETVFPGKFGMPQPWYFFLKEFGDKVAINNMSLNLYKGQISILLGQNGAGKTTIISILTGHYPPTRGEAYIHGYDVSKNMIEIQRNLGFCPQLDLLFNDLTLSEHLFFYSVIKGIHYSLRSTEIDHMLSAFDLLEKRDTFSESLSAGMKRKLSIIIALIGNPQVIILDEPSSSMDPVSRRVTWSLLQQHKTNRTILLTTHYMDEADLGDRIAIMVKGSLQCCGSAVFLKKIYGAGYHIVIETEPYCDTEEISAVIHSHVPSATLENNIGTELSFILPKEYTHRFEALFTDLENKQRELGIARFGASITTMEEVFLKVNVLAESQMGRQSLRKPSLEYKRVRQGIRHNMGLYRSYERSICSKLNEIATIKLNTGFPLYRQQFCSMLIKRALFTLRNWKLMLLQLSVILAVTTYLLRTVNLNHELPSREMDLRQYGRTIVPYSVSGNSDLALNFTKNLKIFLNLKNQELREVQGNLTEYILETKECRDFSIIALSVEVKKNKTVFTILFNNEAYHSPATSLAVFDNVLFMTLSGPNASIGISNKPQPLPVYGSKIVNASGLEILLCLTFGMAVLVGSFCLQTVTEITTKAKHIQFVSGVCVLAYWLAALLWDLICFFIPCCLLLGVFKYCRVDAFVENYHFLDTMMIFMLYSWSAVPLIYLGSFLFSSGAAAYIRLTLFSYFSTVFGTLIHSIMQHYDRDFTEITKTMVNNILMVLPSYNFAMSIIKFFDDYELKKMCTRQFRIINNSIYSFEENGIAKFLITLAAMGFFYLFLLLFLETTFWSLKNFFIRKIVSKAYNVFMKGKKAVVSSRISRYEDDDVEREKKKVRALSASACSPVLLKEVTKIYFKCPVVKAVRNISLQVKKSECFGLLGLNGAGKTTTFKMLTGEETITSGTVLINGISITENIKKVRLGIGYCPQRDPMLSHMTGRELLTMYARLQGVPEPYVSKYVEVFLHSMHLETHADQLSSTYSGGTRRRINAVVALMGKPSAVFMDEPSTGMDPVARHMLWDIITWMCKHGKSIVISSHSMEEGEALCTRVAIMGKFQCLGSPQHLRNKLGNIYSLTAKMKTDNKDELKEFKKFIAKTFPGNIINQDHGGSVGYYIPSKEICWGKVFSILEEAKVLFNLEDYSVSQITLEQIFLTFTNIDKYCPKINL